MAVDPETRHAVIYSQRWFDLMQLLWRIHDGHTTIARMQLKEDEPDDYFDSIVDGFGYEHRLMFKHELDARSRIYRIEFVGLMQGPPPDWNPRLTEWSKKLRCRYQTRLLIGRGEIKRENCSKCGSEDVEAHHPDYDNPRLVVWFCKRCHTDHHKELRRAN